MAKVVAGTEELAEVAETAKKAKTEAAVESAEEVATEVKARNTDTINIVDAKAKKIRLKVILHITRKQELFLR